MTGKAGILHLHLGDGERGLSMVREALQTAEIPARTYNPTHVNRRKALFAEACDLTQQGCWVDVTAFETGDVGYEPADALARYLQSDFPQDKLTISSDGGGCLPCFNEQGHMTKMDFASSSSMTQVFYDLVDSGIAIDKVLPYFTSNVATLMNFGHKGRLSVGADADLLILDNKQRIDHVMAQGQWHVYAKQIVRKGSFEN
jgi:beta-aspartyl-dipeptidase (metallo-type)